jgi:hypothetical protein
MEENHLQKAPISMRKEVIHLAVVALFAFGFVFSSCSPTAAPSALVTLDTTQIGKIAIGGGIRTYHLFLSCGCPFTMAVDSTDTTKLVYDITDLTTSTSSHFVKASERGTLTKGTYTGYVALRMAPPSTDTFHVVLRDTLIVQ